MNRRNAGYILPNNPRKHYPRVDDKLMTKQICESHGIPVPRTYAVIERQGDVRRFGELIGEREEFVVKPTQGSEGRGILVVAHRLGNHWVTAGCEEVSLGDMQYHLSAILAGLYSLGGRSDRVVIEQRILRHATFEQIAVNGTPDIRVIAYRGVPAMAMIRLPTYASRGRANLHQGAVGAGIELHTGRTMGGVWKSRMIDLHPDTRQPIGGMEVPHWNEVLRMSVRLARQLELGYVGVDFVLDQARGPLVLEANARPGLAIQLANRQGLLQRLDTIDACLEEFDSQATRTDSPDVELGLLARLAEA
jgi:alpha-L-glutamate ligase-like protein